MFEPIGYAFKRTDSTCNNMGLNHMLKTDACRRRKESVILKRAKRQDCRKQLAVFTKSDNRRLVGFVNMYNDGKAFWHDVTTSTNLGRSHKIGDEVWTLSERVMRDFSGECDPSVNVYAIRF